MKRFFYENLHIILVGIVMLSVLVLVVFLLLLPGPDIPADLQTLDPDRYTMIANVLGTYVYRFLDGDTVCYLAIDHASGGVSIFCK